MKQRKRIDTNQPLLMKQIRACGFSVFTAHELGKGVPDIIVGAFGKNYLLEVKDPGKPPSKRKLTPDEIEFHSAWKGQISVVETIDDILKILKP